jgi:predicted Zn-dependent protease
MFQAQAAKKKEIENQNKLQAIFQRDSQLPVEVRKDKYMVALTAHLKNERYQESMQYFEWLQRLNTELSPSFNYFYGEALLKTGSTNAAITELYAYIKEVGSKGKFYKQALGMVNDGQSGKYDTVNKPNSDQLSATSNVNEREALMFKHKITVGESATPAELELDTLILFLDAPAE